MSQATLTRRPYVNSNLFSGHYLDRRVQERAEWDCDDAAREAMEDLQSLHDLEGPLVSGYGEDALIDNWIDEVLEVLGFGTQEEVTLPNGGGYVDELLFETPGTRRAAASVYLDTGDTTDLFERGLGIVEAKQWDAPFDIQFSEQRPYRNASHQTKHYLENTPPNIQWGVLTNGRKWRLYGTNDYETQTYYEVDLPELLERGDLAAFKYFYVFFRPAAFHESGGTTFHDEVWSESETASQELGENLQDNVFTALRVLGRGFVETNDDLDIDPDDEAALDDLKEQSLVLLYQLMFVLYAEARGLIHPDGQAAQDEYDQNFSLDELRLEIHEAIGEVDEGFDDEFSEYSTTMWSRLTDLFKLIDEGEADLGIPPYNGGLFDHEAHDFLEDHEVSNQHLAEVIYRLSTTRDDDGRFVLADYADLDTRHLGSVYEGLLEHQFRIAPAEYAAVAEDGGQVWKPATEVTVADAVETVPAGGLYVVNDEGERKATGAYYTPDYVVTYIVEETIGPLVEEIREDLEAQGIEPGTQEALGPFLQRVMDLRILDPAMGSGHFLTKATSYLANETMKEYREAETEIGMAFDEGDIRREIAKECIYGVDLNGMAVELAKLSMWLETLAADRPLAFLDHHFKQGNSLVGSDIEAIEELESDATDGEEQSSLAEFGVTREGTIERLMDIYGEFLEIENETVEDVHAMKRKYAEIEQDELRQRLVAMANVHTAERFGVDVPGGAYQRMAKALEDDEEWEAVKGTDWFPPAQEVAEEQSFFHWKLAFPEAFYDANGSLKSNPGFDVVIGNPPYIRIQELRGHNAEQAEYLIDKYESATKSFDIYVNFTEKGHSLLHEDGLLGYIEPHKFFQSDFGEGLRNYIANNRALREVVSFGRHQVFQGASVYTCVLILQSGGSDKLRYAEINPETLIRGQEWAFHTMDANYTEDPWVFQSPEILQVLESIEQVGPSLETITSKIYQGVVTSADDIYLVEVIESNGDYVIAENGKGEQIEVESELVKPFLKGQDVKRYAPLNPPQQIILPYEVAENKPPKFIKEGTLMEEYPKAYSYFKSHESELRGRDGGSMDSARWYDLTRNQNMGEFSKSKLITPEISYGSNFTNDSEGVFHKSKVYGIIFEGEWDQLRTALLGVLNSSLLWFYLRNTGYVLRGGYFTFKTDYLNPFCVPEKQGFDTEWNGGTYKQKLSTCVTTQIEAHQKRQSFNLDLLDYIRPYKEGPSVTEIGHYQPPSGVGDTKLRATTEAHPNLRVGTVTCERADAHTVVVHATARYKPDDPEAHETDQWDYTETESLPAMRLSDLTETEADLVEAFVPVAVEEAGGFAGFRETATQTNSLVDRLEAITLPDPDDVAEDLARYRDAVERAVELDEKIERTDALIDEIVYDLYGLTDEEIEIVEEAVGD